MKNYLTISLNWIKRMRKYGFRNTLILRQNLKKNSEYTLRFQDYSFVLRGNTVDFSVFESILFKMAYDIDLGFVPAVIVDAGANIGAASLFFRLKYPEAKIIALEPEESNYEIMQKNLSGFHNIDLLNRALWDKDTSLSLVNPGAEKYAFQVDENNGEGAEIQGVSVSTLMEEYHLEVIDLLKIDIEGAERFLFSKEKVTWLTNVKVIIIEIHEILYPGTRALFFNALKQIDYRMTERGEDIIIFNKRFTGN